MSWIADLKTIIDRMPEELPPFTPRGIGKSREPYVRHKAQRRGKKTYHYWTVQILGSTRVRYFPYTARGLCEALIFRDTMIDPCDPYIEERKRQLAMIGEDPPPPPRSQTPKAIYMRAYNRGFRKRARA